MGKNIFKINVTRRAILTSIFIVLIQPICLAQTDDYYKDSFIRYENRVYKSYIQTVWLGKEGSDFQQTVFNLNALEILNLTFDDLDADVKNYKYKLIHCTYDWKDSHLSESDFVGGFNNEQIYNYKYSFNTIVPYTHYSLQIPNEYMRPIISGNYILLVFIDSEDQPAITRRFCITDNKVMISARVHRATDLSIRNTHQEVDFKIFTNDIELNNPFEDLKIVIQQNDRWDNAIYNLKPLFVRDKELDYNHDDINNFPAGNEFRRFDTRTTRYAREGVSHIRYGDKYTDVVLNPAMGLAYKKYSFENDLDGRRKVENAEGLESGTDADYVNVHFVFSYPAPITEGTIYVFGELTDWQLLPNARMHYKEDDKYYYTSLLLKQGYYNYQFVVLKDGDLSIDLSQTEGNHFETTNQYTIYAYFRPSGSRYDHLVGVQVINADGTQ